MKSPNQHIIPKPSPAGPAASLVDPLQYQLSPINSTYQDKADSHKPWHVKEKDCFGRPSLAMTVCPNKDQSLRGAAEAISPRQRANDWWITDAGGSVNQFTIRSYKGKMEYVTIYRLRWGKIREVRYIAREYNYNVEKE